MWRRLEPASIVAFILSVIRRQQQQQHSAYYYLRQPFFCSRCAYLIRIIYIIAVAVADNKLVRHRRLF